MIKIAAQNRDAALDGILEELALVKEKSALTANKYLSAIYIALLDEKVKNLWLDKVSRGLLPQFVESKQSIIPENIVVVFPFKCADGVFCFLNPSFAVVVDWLNQQVVAIHDPYMVGPEEDAHLIGPR